MAFLPNNYDVTTPQGSEWSTTFGIQNSDGTPANITGKTFEFVIRRAVTDVGTPLLSVNSTTSTSDGSITVNVSAATVQVVLTATGTNKLINGGGVYALWMDPGLVYATALAVGTFYCLQVVAP